ncbi:MAG: DAK2 domain-containing protein [Oscillospiraceae bacterium]|nr:DAK2 domain-containing protein [Oscillospiraceae bacterium]
MVDVINGVQFAEMILSASAAVEGSRQELNELNVFPVPDGDTGTNMSLSMAAGAAMLRDSVPESIGQCAELAASGLLRGARGNSGVILSLLFRGFAKRVKAQAEMSGIDLADALQEGSDAAWRVVMKPADGTILTVSACAAKRALDAAREDTAFEYVLGQALEASNIALEQTVYQNPILSKAGVVDAGGKGLCVIFDGMLAALRGRPYLTQAPQKPSALSNKADFSGLRTEDITFCYCTEFLIMREKSKDPMSLRAYLSSMGDSLVLVDDDEIIKVHIHTNNPGSVLEAALEYGQLTSIKIDNMRQQHTEALALERSVTAFPLKPAGIVSVCAGDGLADIFRDLGVDIIVQGGQTMNPSTQDILAAAEEAPGNTVFIFPNNKNIIMAAQQCNELTEKEVIVIPTRSIPEGVAALLAFDPGAALEANRQSMLSAMAGVSTGLITYAARESSFDGHDIRQGDHMALFNGQLLSAGVQESFVLESLAFELAKNNPAYLTIFYGEDIDAVRAGEVQGIFSRICQTAECTVLYGGQPVYRYIISAE